MPESTEIPMCKFFQQLTALIIKDYALVSA